MFCPCCGREISDSACFCEKCGRRLGEDVTCATMESQPCYPGGEYRTVIPRPMPSVPSHLGWAIVWLILFFGPTAIPAIVYASRVDDRVAVGDCAGAQEASRNAKTWCWVSTGIAIAGVAIAVVAGLVLFGLARTFI